MLQKLVLKNVLLENEEQSEETMEEDLHKYTVADPVKILKLENSKELNRVEIVSGRLERVERG